MAVAAMRGRLALVALLFALAGAAWWISAVRMGGMTTMGGYGGHARPCHGLDERACHGLNRQQDHGRKLG